MKTIDFKSATEKAKGILNEKTTTVIEALRYNSMWEDPSDISRNSTGGPMDKEKHGWTVDELLQGISPTLLVETGHQIVQSCSDIEQYDKAAFGLLCLGREMSAPRNEIAEEKIRTHVDFSFEWMSAHVDRMSIVDGYYGHKILNVLGNALIFFGENIDEYPDKYKELEYKLVHDDDDQRSEEILELWASDCMNHGRILKKFYKYPLPRVSKSILWLGRYHQHIWL